MKDGITGEQTEKEEFGKEVGVIHRCFSDPEISLEDNGYRYNPFQIKDFDGGVLDTAYKNIDWSPEEASLTRKFVHLGQVFYMIHSTPAIWSIHDKEPFIVDSILIAKSPEIVQKAWEREVIVSNELKKKRVDAVAPFVYHILSDEHVKIVLGRGSIYDGRRMAHEKDDVDLVVFMDWNGQEELNGILSRISEAASVLTDKRIKLRGMTFLDQDEIFDFNNLMSEYSAFLDIIPIQFITFAEQSSSFALAKFSGNYVINMFRNAELLGGDAMLMKRILNLCNMVEKRRK
ncbi:hypothetical protein M0R04_02855 [Candidatus Dojkabacteria bacterium]|jgi:hypothetical protein|nr:hypothetical protein [Candidatus Dojkabacteria bacterium]